jgi:hypothetical protein
MKLEEKRYQHLLAVVAEQVHSHSVPELAWDYFVLHPIQAFWY